MRPVPVGVLRHVAADGAAALRAAVGEDRSTDEDWLYGHAGEFVESVDDGPELPVHDALRVAYEIDDDEEDERGTSVVTLTDGVSVVQRDGHRMLDEDPRVRFRLGRASDGSPAVGAVYPLD